MENHEHKLDLQLKPIPRKKALELIKAMHYSDTLPKTTKLNLGVFIGGNLEGVITLGWGTRPKQTIKKLFPSLNLEDYFEIGRMCINDSFKTNTESQLLSKTVKYLKKNYPQIKVLFTWSDGILGKVGTVYQASNFLYGGFNVTDIYIYKGVKIHPRGMKYLLSPTDKRISVRPNAEQKKKYGIKHIRGRQFRYVYFLCGFSEKERLIKESQFNWSIDYPSYDDCKWEQWVDYKKWEECDMPPFKTDNKRTVINNQRSLEEYINNE